MLCSLATVKWDDLDYCNLLPLAVTFQRELPMGCFSLFDKNMQIEYKKNSTKIYKKNSRKIMMNRIDFTISINPSKIITNDYAFHFSLNERLIGLFAERVSTIALYKGTTTSISHCIIPEKIPKNSLNYKNFLISINSLFKIALENNEVLIFTTNVLHISKKFNHLKVTNSLREIAIPFFNFKTCLTLLGIDQLKDAKFTKDLCNAFLIEKNDFKIKLLICSLTKSDATKTAALTALWEQHSSLKPYSVAQTAGRRQERIIAEDIGLHPQTVVIKAHTYPLFPKTITEQKRINAEIIYFLLNKKQII